MKGRVIAVLMLGVLDGLAFPHLALAYRALADDPEIASDVSVVWAASRITLTVSRGDLPSAQREVLATAVEGAVARWNGVACADLELVVGSGTGPAAPEDARNTVEWIANGWALRGFPVGVAATTDIRLQRTDMGAWSIVEADIYVNADEFEWDILGGAGPVSVGPALVHELGHFRISRGEMAETRSRSSACAAPGERRGIGQTPSDARCELPLRPGSPPSRWWAASLREPISRLHAR